VRRRLWIVPLALAVTASGSGPNREIGGLRALYAYDRHAPLRVTDSGPLNAGHAVEVHARQAASTGRDTCERA
jgi:hypothetical protein